MRAGWLSRLEALGVPFVVMVGGGDGRRDGDVVHLDAPDDYEGLPRKTLAAMRWLRDNTAFGHVIKIDDDCFMDPDAYLLAQSWRKFDYHGRRLVREEGQLDRAWHQSKSCSDRGRLELDKSPDTSVYADGGSAYALSRTAMSALLAETETPAGRQLTRASFMEDKLVGDLLARAGISVFEEDHYVTVRRRARPGGIPVPRWVDGFDAGPAAPVKVVHLDTARGQAAALEGLSAPRLRPSKLWPSDAPPRLVSDTNALELISAQDRLSKVNAAEVAVVASMRNEMFMLPHFLEHYRKLGVGGFLVADNGSDDGTLEHLHEQPDVAVFAVDTDYGRSQYGVAWQRTLMASLRVGRWSLVVDADELLAIDAGSPDGSGASLTDLLATPAFERADAARLFMLDMYPSGPLAEADFVAAGPFTQADHCDRDAFLTTSASMGPFSDQPTWTSGLRHRLVTGSRPELFVAQKIALMRYRPWMRLSAGLHFCAEARLAERELLLCHFKYNAAFRRKALTEVRRRQHFNDAEEYRKYQAILAEGHDTLHDPELSVHWRENGAVRRLLG
jgi:hypothetical protein